MWLALLRWLRDPRKNASALSSLSLERERKREAPAGTCSTMVPYVERRRLVRRLGSSVLSVGPGKLIDCEKKVADQQPPWPAGRELP